MNSEKPILMYRPRGMRENHEKPEIRKWETWKQTINLRGSKARRLVLRLLIQTQLKFRTQIRQNIALHSALEPTKGQGLHPIRHD